MNVINLTCNHCGAPLEAAEGTKFLTCRFCSSRLAIEHSESAFYTHVLEALESQTNALSQDLETIKIQNEIERLDREWQMECEQLCRRGKDGRLQEPTVIATVIGSVFLAAFGLVWLFMVSAASSASRGHGVLTLFSLVGLGIIVLSIAGLIRGIPKAKQYEYSRTAYESRRRRLEGDLVRRNANG